MTTDLVIYQFKTHPVTVHTDKQGYPHWIAKEVCKILGISGYRHAISKLDADERGSLKVHTLGGIQEMITVNEPGLYRLIMRSNKPISKQFQHWVAHKILPTIRKTGSYSMRPEVAPENSISEKMVRMVGKMWEAGIALTAIVIIPMS